MSDCERRTDGSGEWICDRCKSLWTDMLAGTGWLPLSCPDRANDYRPQPAKWEYDERKMFPFATSRHTMTD
jgi:hypothetical protein